MARTERVPARGKRTAVLLVAAVLMGALGHVLVGGPLGGSSLAVAAAVVLPPTWLATARELRFPTIAGLLVIGQVNTHTALTLTMVGHYHHPGGEIVPTLPMLAAHGLATLLLAWWIRRGERRLWAGLRALVRVVFGKPQLPVAVRHRLPITDAAILLRSVLLQHSLVSRGPPAAV